MTPEQTLLILFNCPKYTPKIKAQLEKLANFKPSHRATKDRTPAWVTNPNAKKLWLTDISDLEFCFGEWEYPKLCDLVHGCINYNKESEHLKNVYTCARRLVNNI